MLFIITGCLQLNVAKRLKYALLDSDFNVALKLTHASKAWSDRQKLVLFGNLVLR